MKYQIEDRQFVESKIFLNEDVLIRSIEEDNTEWYAYHDYEKVVVSCNNKPRDLNGLRWEEL